MDAVKSMRSLLDMPEFESELIEEKSGYSRLTDLAPKEWFTGSTERAVWMRIYDALRVELPALPAPGATLEFSITDDVHVVIRPAGFNYPERPGVTQLGGVYGTPQKTPGLVELPPGTYTILMTPFDDSPEGETDAVRRIDIGAAMCAAVLSPRLVFRQITEHAEWVDTKRCKVMSDAFRNPDLFRPAELTKPRVTLLRRAGAAIEALGPDDRNRCRLALRWYRQALADTRVDAFLKIWIAIECLAQMGSSDWKKLAKVLAREYGTTFDVVARDFDLAELAQLRHDVFHRGATPFIHGRILLVAFGVFEDVLLNLLGLPTERRAAAALGGTAFDVKALTSGARG